MMNFVVGVAVGAAALALWQWYRNPQDEYRQSDQYAAWREARKQAMVMHPSGRVIPIPIDRMQDEPGTLYLVNGKIHRTNNKEQGNAQAE